MNKQDIIDRMAYHPATATTAPMFDELRTMFLVTALDALEFVPEGREQSLMITHLEEALMWGSKAIALTTPVDDKTASIARVLPTEPEVS